MEKKTRNSSKPLFLQQKTTHRFFDRQILCAALGAAFLFIAPQNVLADGVASANVDQGNSDMRLRSGGHVLVMRHASSPHDQSGPVGLSEGCRLGEGRGLDALGLYQARALGAFLKNESAPLLGVYTSRMCRSWDTARLAAGGATVQPHDSQMTTDSKEIAVFKDEIVSLLLENPGHNILLVSHSNIAPLYGAYAKGDEEEVPSGVVFLVEPDQWRALARYEVHGAQEKWTVSRD